MPIFKSTQKGRILITTMNREGEYKTLIAQLDKLARHNRQGSFRTKERYYMAAKRFCRFLAEEYHLQKLANVSGKHMVSYVLYLQQEDKSASTVKTDLAAIRFFHDKISVPRYTLPAELERRRFGQKDRTWTPDEFARLLELTGAAKREDYLLAFHLARYAGLRIHECFRLDTAAAEDALRIGTLTVKGKGGKVRAMPVTEEIRKLLQERLAKTARGHKLLVPDDLPTDKAITALQQFLLDHRTEIQDPDDTRPLTFHGLRHTYAAEKYTIMRKTGTPELDAHFAVSRLLGHERPDVTDIYLASVKK